MGLKLIDVELIERYGYAIHRTGYITRGGIKLKMTPNTSGYLRVGLLLDNNKRESYLVHRLVATKYLIKVDGKSFVNHKDKDKLNNADDNLEWCTAAENMQHAYMVADGAREEAKRLVSIGFKKSAAAKILGVSAASVANWVNDVDQAAVKRLQRDRARLRGTLSYKGSQTLTR